MITGLMAFVMGFFMNMSNIYGISVFFTIVISLARSQAVVANLTVIGRWFPKHGRGLILAIWMWQEPVGDIWGAVLFRVMSGKDPKDLGVPLLIIGSVMVIFGIKNYIALTQSPEFKGLKIEEDFTLRDKRAILQDSTVIEKEARRQALIKEFNQRLPVDANTILDQRRVIVLGLVSVFFYFSFYTTL